MEAEDKTGFDVVVQKQLLGNTILEIFQSVTLGEYVDPLLDLGFTICRCVVCEVLRICCFLVPLLSGNLIQEYLSVELLLREGHSNDT